MKRFVMWWTLFSLLFVAACKPESRGSSPLPTPKPRPSTIAQQSPLSTLPAEAHGTLMIEPTPPPPGSIVHIIEPGDTLQSLALKYNVPLDQILQLNQLEVNSLLRIGQRLVIATPLTEAMTPTPIQATTTPWPALSPTSLPTIVPPIQTASIDHLPPITHDLLFLSDTNLMLWHHATQQIEVLAGPGTADNSRSILPVSLRLGPGAPIGSVTGFSVSDDGRKVAYTQYGRIVNGFEVYTMTLLDRDTQHRTLLLRSDDRQQVSWPSISPDGQWFAYLTQDGRSASNRSVGLAAPSMGGGVVSGTIKAVRVDVPDQPIEIGHCTDESTQEVRLPCQGFLWSSDSRAIAWADGRGIWVAEPGEQPRQLAASKLTMPGSNPQGIYSLSQWSPSGRYLLVHISHYEGSTTGVLDIQTGSISTVPNSFEYAYPGPGFAWLNDDRLLVARPAAAYGGTTPSIEIWRFDIANPLTYTQSSAMPVGVGNFPTTPAVFPDRHVGLLLMNASNSNYRDRGVYFIDVNDLSSHKVNGIPPLGRADDLVFPVTTAWSPDGSGVIVQDLERNYLLYVPTDGTSPFDLSPITGEYTCCFTWLEN